MAENVNREIGLIDAARSGHGFAGEQAQDQQHQEQNHEDAEQHFGYRGCASGNTTETKYTGNHCHDHAIRAQYNKFMTVSFFVWLRSICVEEKALAAQRSADGGADARPLIAPDGAADIGAAAMPGL